jgi:uncharacterized protein
VSISNTLLQFNTIFLSILIEALPFVIISLFLSGIIQIFVTEEMISKIIPKNRYLAVVLAAFLGVFFLTCECGIVLIVNRLIKKGVPPFAGIAFMLTAPILNPVVLFATYVAFGNSWTMVWNRAWLAFAVAVLVGWLLPLFYKGNPLKHIELNVIEPHTHEQTWKQKWFSSFAHAAEEFFQMGKYLIFGALIAAAVQVWMPTSLLLSLGQGKVASSLIMMGMAYLLSLCSEADAFIAVSFANNFLASSLVAFMVFGPMFDIKQTTMMFSTFKSRFVFVLFALVVVLILGGSLLIGGR